MPKRPCAITFTPDQKTILCGDKFGDVYALPLLPSEPKSDRTLEFNGTVRRGPLREREAKFAPSATLKTVHTLKNRKALRHQLNSTEKKPSQKLIDFEHQLLLGHVSLLTDILCVSVPNKNSTGSPERTYIITADRDEHIRVSRGPPQAHVIEGFCLGHTQFVSKLCVACWDPQTLISGGGDDHLLVWNWVSGCMVKKIDLQKQVLHNIDLRFLCHDPLGPDPVDYASIRARFAKIAISEILTLKTEIVPGEVQRHIVVTVEGIPAVFFFELAEDGEVERQMACATQLNVVALTASEDQSCIAYALDTDRKPFTQSPISDKDARLKNAVALTVSKGQSSIGFDMDTDGESSTRSSISSEVAPEERPSIGFFSYSAAEGLWERDTELQDKVTRALQSSEWSDEKVASDKKQNRPGRYLPEYHEAKGDNDFFACCRSPEIASTLTLQPIDRYDGLIDAAIIFSDILVIPQAMGMTVEMLDRKGPHFPNPLKSPTDTQYEELMTRKVDVGKELDYVYQAITMTRQKLQGRVPLYGFCGAPWTLLCYMVEGGGSKLFVQVKTWIYKYPTESKKLLQKIAELCVEYLALQVKAGAQIVQVFDSWAAELSPASFKEFALPYLQHISHNLPSRLRELGIDIVPMVVFAKGAWYALDDLCDSRYDVVGLDWLQDPAEAVRIARGRVVLQGNADPGVLYGGKEAITETVRNMVTGFGGGKQRWIVNLGHGMFALYK
ncbi:MAG: hypothetical protein Q9219_007281 [cf. Caloplaca sp. 3 TL-2023]